MAVLGHRTLDGVTGVILSATAVFMPWAFGTTQDWAIWTMNWAGYALGALLVAKWMLRAISGYSPPTWCLSATRHGGGAAPGSTVSRRAPRLPGAAMMVLTVLLLAFCWISAWNARATYLPNRRALEYHSSISWLPQSYDRTSTWDSFWMYLGLACFFWAARDWLRSATERESQEYAPSEDEAPPADPDAPSKNGRPTLLALPHRYYVPARLRWLLCVICLNGSLVAAEGIVQRMSGDEKLLFFREPRPGPLNHFGPYAYRGNACQYLNLIWPVCAGFAWLLARSAERARRTGVRHPGRLHWWLGLGAIVMAAAPFVSANRGGALVAAALVLPVSILLIVANRRRGATAMAIFLLLCVALELGVALGWDRLSARFETAFTDHMSGRTLVYEDTRRMAADRPLFGVGPGTFYSLHRFYLTGPKHRVEAYAHNDWLELRATFGWVGYSMILLLLILAGTAWVWEGGVAVHWVLPGALTVAIAGCLLHARFDFPFRIYSVTCLFLLLCAVSGCLSLRREHG